MNEILMSMPDARPADHPPVAAGRIGVLLVNLGTPDATDYFSMRRYLREFLSDRRVIDENRLKWWLALNLIILTVRPSRKGRDYDKIWNRERDESPLKTTTRAQAEKLGATLSSVDARITVDWAMRASTELSVAPSFSACARVVAFSGDSSRSRFHSVPDA